MKLTQQDMARILDITTATLRNWRKDKPNLYKIVMQGFAVEDAKNILRESIEKLESVGENSKGAKG
jgi:transcriptional regulator with XRE-family HTH domain